MLTDNTWTWLQCLTWRTATACALVCGCTIETRQSEVTVIPPDGTAEETAGDARILFDGGDAANGGDGYSPSDPLLGDAFSGDTFSGDAFSGDTLSGDSICLPRFRYARELVTDPTKIGGGGPLMDFPMLVVFTQDPHLRNVTQSGHVFYANAADLGFFLADAPLSHEIERYDGEVGDLVAWVRLPTLAADAPTTLTMKYGDPCAAEPSPSAGVWSDAFELVYHLGGSLADSTTHGRDGSGYGAPPASPGPVGLATAFNGTNQYIDSLYNDDLVQWTISCWARGDTMAGAGDDTGCLMREVNYNLAWHHQSANYQSSVFYFDGTNWIYADLGPLQADTWYYLVGTYDGTTVTSYTNGQPVAAKVTAGPDVETHTAKIARHAVADYYFAGSVDEIRIESAPRSADWILTTYNNQISPATFYAVGAEQSL